MFNEAEIVCSAKKTAIPRPRGEKQIPISLEKATDGTGTQSVPIHGFPLNDLAEQYSYEYGESYDSYLINDGNRSIFYSVDGKGLLGYIQDHKYIHVIGGLLAANAEEKNILLQSFLKKTQHWGVKVVLFHNILEDDLPLFETFGVEATKCGEEAIIDLQQTDWTSSSYQWVRRQESYCRRKGILAGEIHFKGEEPSIDPSISTELEFISHEHVKQTITGKEFSYFAGRLILSDLKRKRIFIAKSKLRIEAFIVCNPGLGGQFYAIEMYRFRKDAPRGVMPCLWMHALRQLKTEGVATASLCMMPFYNCHLKHPLDNAFLRFCNHFWFHHLNWLFNAKGLHLYKSRFRPIGRPMYTVAYPQTSLGSLYSAFKLWEISSVLAPRTMVKRILQRFRIR